jgi:hypothetical protein
MYIAQVISTDLNVIKHNTTSSKMSSSDSRNYGDATMPIAIVGMAARFSGEATNPSKLWDMMVQGRTGHSAVPENRFDAEAWYHPSHERRGTVGFMSPKFAKEMIDAMC